MSGDDSHEFKTRPIQASLESTEVRELIEGTSRRRQRLHEETKSEISPAAAAAAKGRNS